MPNLHRLEQSGSSSSSTELRRPAHSSTTHLGLDPMSPAGTAVADAAGAAGASAAVPRRPPTHHSSPVPLLSTPLTASPPTLSPPTACARASFRTWPTTNWPKMAPSSSFRGSQLSRVSTDTANRPKMAPEAPNDTLTTPWCTAGCSRTDATAAPALGQQAPGTAAGRRHGGRGCLVWRRHTRGVRRQVGPDQTQLGDASCTASGGCTTAVAQPAPTYCRHQVCKYDS